MALLLGDFTQSDLSCGGLAPAASVTPVPLTPSAACKALAQQLEHNMPYKMTALYKNISLDDAIQHIQTHARLTCRGRAGQVRGTCKQL